MTKTKTTEKPATKPLDVSKLFALVKEYHADKAKTGKAYAAAIFGSALDRDAFGTKAAEMLYA
jgi:hypothetical protein